MSNATLADSGAHLMTYGVGRGANNSAAPSKNVIDLTQLEMASQLGKNVVNNPRKLQITTLPSLKQQYPRLVRDSQET